MVQDVLLRGEGTEAVSEQYQGQAGVLLADGLGEGDHVTDESVPAVVPEMTGLGVPAQPVSAVIVGIDGVALSGQYCREWGVTAGVLSHAVGDLDDGSRWGVRLPFVHVDLDAVFAVEGEHRTPCPGYAGSPERPAELDGVGRPSGSGSRSLWRTAVGAARPGQACCSPR